MRFVDWIPGVCSALGMLVINSIEKSRLSADSYSYSGTGVALKARLVLFLGFALLAGGVAGSVVSFGVAYAAFFFFSLDSLDDIYGRSDLRGWGVLYKRRNSSSTMPTHGELYANHWLCPRPSSCSSISSPKRPFRGCGSE